MVFAVILRRRRHVKRRPRPESKRLPAKRRLEAGRVEAGLEQSGYDLGVDAVASGDVRNCKRRFKVKVLGSNPDDLKLSFMSEQFLCV